MPCDFVARIGTILRIKQKQTLPSLVISQPFNFQSGPAVNFPGYSEDDISLMREKAIASTAITDDDASSFDYVSRRPPSRPRSRAGSTGFGLSARVVYHARRVSRGGRGVLW